MTEKTLAEHRADHKRTLREKVTHLAGHAKHHEFPADKAHRLADVTAPRRTGNFEGTGLPPGKMENQVEED